MRNEPIAWLGIAMIGLMAGLGGPKLLSKAKLAARRATGTTYRSGAPSYGRRATADPARGFPS